MKIIPMRDLKNTVEVEKTMQRRTRTYFVTKNGYGETSRDGYRIL